MNSRAGENTFFNIEYAKRGGTTGCQPHIYIYIYIYIHVCVCIYIYIYIERERYVVIQIEIETCIHTIIVAGKDRQPQRRVGCRLRRGELQHHPAGARTGVGGVVLVLVVVAPAVVEVVVVVVVVVVEVVVVVVVSVVE